jgi:outer membrane immunogenic protein
MKRLLVVAALVAMVGASAFAADLSPRMYTKAAPVVAPVYNWTGWYAGINGGYSWQDSSVGFSPGNAVTANFFDNILPAGVTPRSVGVDPKGGLFGGQIGYNWQTGVWVLGLEADLDWADIKSSGAATGPVFPRRGLEAYTAMATQKIDAFGTLRARVGITPTDRVLLYATGGLAYGHTKLDTNYSGATCELCAVGSSSAWKTGWTAGAGVEWAFQNNWTLRGEYLYYDLGSVDHVLTDPTAPGAAVNAHADYRGNIVRAALNYKFAP